MIKRIALASLLLSILAGFTNSKDSEASKKIDPRAIIEISYHELAVQNIADEAYRKLEERIHDNALWLIIIIILGSLGAVFGGNFLIQRAVESIAKGPVEKTLSSLDTKRDELNTLVVESKIRTSEQLTLLQELGTKMHQLAKFRGKIENDLSELQKKFPEIDERINAAEQELASAQQLINDKVNNEIKVAEERTRQLADVVKQTLQDKAKIDEYLKKVDSIDKSLENKRSEFEHHMNIRVRIRFNEQNANTAETLRNFLIGQGYKAFTIAIKNVDLGNKTRIIAKPQYIDTAKEIMERIKHIITIDKVLEFLPDKNPMLGLLLPDVSITLVGERHRVLRISKST